MKALVDFAEIFRKVFYHCYVTAVQSVGPFGPLLNSFLMSDVIFNDDDIDVKPASQIDAPTTRN